MLSLISVLQVKQHIMVWMPSQQHATDYSNIMSDSAEGQVHSMYCFSGRQHSALQKMY